MKHARSLKRTPPSLFARGTTHLHSGRLRAARLRGRRLACLKRGGDAGGSSAYSWSDRKDLYLCSDGSFQGSGSFSGAIDTSGGFGSTGDNTGQQVGQWRVTSVGGAPVLELRNQTGQTTQFQLSTDGSKTFLDGERWNNVENAVCP